MKLITKYTATATWMIPDETKAKLMEYIQTHKEELKCDRYHEQLEKAYEAICGSPDDDILDWYIEP